MNVTNFTNSTVLLGKIPREHDNWEVLILAIPLLLCALCVYALVRLPKESTRLRTCAFLSGGLLLALLCCGLLLSSVARVLEAGPRMLSANNLKQIGHAIHTYQDQHRYLPCQAICDQDGKPLLSWRVAVLPYIEHDNLYKQFHLDEPWDSPHNLRLLKEMPGIYVHPVATEESNRNGLTHYQAFVSKLGPGEGQDKGRFFTVIVADPNARLKLKDIHEADGTSNTFMVAEAASPVPWTAPMDLSDTPQLGDLGRFFGDKIQVLCADTSISFYAVPDLDESRLLAGVRANDGKTVEDH